MKLKTAAAILFAVSASLASAQAQETAPGLVGSYYRGVNSMKALDGQKGSPFFLRVDKQIDFPLTEGNFYDSKCTINFGVRWVGNIHIDQAGKYEFSVNADDEAKLFIDNKQIVKRTGEGVALSPPTTGSVDLTPGDHKVKLEFWQGPGQAGCTLSWKTPGSDKVELVPTAALSHEKSQELVNWDSDKYHRAILQHERVKEDVGRWATIDYGPFLSHTILIGDESTNKGITIKVGKKDDACMLFDTEMLNFTGGWTGGFINFTGVVFDGHHGVNPTPAGAMVFKNHPEPGAWEGEIKDKSLKDPRPRPFGPLPREWGRYKGLYLDGNNIVLTYQVGSTFVMDLPGFERINDKPVLTRTLRLSASNKPLTILALDERNGDAALFASSDAKQVKVAGRTYLVFPPRRNDTEYKIAITRADDKVPATALVHSIVTKPDLATMENGGPQHWPKDVVMKGEVGKGTGPYVVDTIAVPEENPYKSWMRIGGFDFFSDGHSAAVCNWSGDVWVVTGIDDTLKHLKWHRYATGLFQALGLKIVNDEIYVVGRDQITRLHDLNHDGEADYYECFNNDCEVSSSFHEFTFGLDTDSKGNFYYTKAGPVRPGGRGWQILTAHNGCMLRVSPDGQKFEVFATGLRAPNGMGIGPHDEITVGDNEGTWVPACPISFVHKGDFLGVPDTSKENPEPKVYLPHLCWLPHGDVDNSSGCQIWVPSENRWGPFDGELLHLSYGKCSLFKVLKEDVDGMWQGGVVKFPLQFNTGIMRARFNKADGQLYVAGLRGWQTDGAKDAGFQRVRYTGKQVNMPTDMHIKKDGIEITFTNPLDPTLARDPESFAIEQWNLIWSGDYGSPEMSVENPKEKGHDPVDIDSVQVSNDYKTVFLKIKDLKPVMEMKIDMKLKAADGSPMNYQIYNTINRVPGLDAKPVVSSAVSSAK